MDQETVYSEKLNNSTASSEKTKLPFGLLADVYEQVGNCRGENSKNHQKALLSNLFKTLIRESP